MQLLDNTLKHLNYRAQYRDEWLTSLKRSMSTGKRAGMLEALEALLVNCSNDEHIIEPCLKAIESVQSSCKLRSEMRDDRASRRPSDKNLERLIQIIEQYSARLAEDAPLNPITNKWSELIDLLDDVDCVEAANLAAQGYNSMKVNVGRFVDTYDWDADGPLKHQAYNAFVGIVERMDAAQLKKLYERRFQGLDEMYNSLGCPEEQSCKREDQLDSAYWRAGSLYLSELGCDDIEPETPAVA